MPRVQVSAEVNADTDEHGAILFDAQAGMFYWLNAAGALFWATLVETGEFDAGVQAVANRFDVDPATVRSHMTALATQLEQCGLVTMEA